jgi:hypothetical protein
MLRILHCLDIQQTYGGKVVSPTHRPQYPLDEARWAPLPIWTRRTFLTLLGLELRPLNRPARSLSLYQLRYPNSHSARRGTIIAAVHGTFRLRVLGKMNIVQSRVSYSLNPIRVSINDHAKHLPVTNHSCEPLCAGAKYTPLPRYAPISDLYSFRIRGRYIIEVVMGKFESQRTRNALHFLMNAVRNAICRKLL